MNLLNVIERLAARPTRTGRQLGRPQGRPYATAAAIGVAALAATALVNHRLARRAERRNPPRGRFLDVDGVRLHYVEHGEGEPLVLLHGNGSMIQDFESSGLLEMAAEKYRVIAFDRPGYGHTPRPRPTFWSPEAQADLIHGALEQLDATPAIVLGHSWGTLVAAALGSKHPESVKALVLASGYYYPSPRLDVVAATGMTLPIVGAILRYTLSPIVSRLMWRRLMRKIFGPAPVPPAFERGFPVGLAVRPSQLRASAAESALMIPSAVALQSQLGKLRMPVVIVAGALDRLIGTEDQSGRLHGDLADSSYHPVPGAGHMVHQTAPRAVMAAIDEAAGAAEAGPTARIVRELRS